MTKKENWESLEPGTMRVAVVVGFDYHVGVLCQKVNAHSKSWKFLPYPSTKLGIARAFFKIRGADALIRFGGSAPHGMLMAAARANNVPMYVIWAGSDVTRAIGFPTKIPQARRTEITHLAVAPWLANELQWAGIEAKYIPIIGVKPVPGLEIPRERFEVLTYLPEPRRDFYGKPHVYEVAARLPNITFLVVGSGEPDASAPSNVRFLGWLPDISPVLDRCAAVLRVPDHDGMSLMVLEALARGRFVAWNHIVPGAHHVQTPAETFDFLSELYTRWSANNLPVNTQGIEYISSRYDEAKVALGVQRFLDQSVDASSRTRTSPRRVAIMGLDIFVADVANQNNQLGTGWNAQVLQFETNYELVGSMATLARSDVLYTVGTPMLGRSMGIAAAVLRKPRVMHWVGTDIEAARRNKRIAQSLRDPSITHLTEVEWEAEELRCLGIDAKIAPLPPRFSGPLSVPPLPSEFTLLTYLPRSRTDFYGKRELELIIQSFSGLPVRFLIVGGGEVDVPSDARIENLGWRYSLADVYACSSALFRFTPRDGLSLMVLEALSFGRHVLWTKSFPFVQCVRSLEAATAALHELLVLQQQGALKPQLDAARFVQAVYDRKRCINQIVSAWDTACSRFRLKSPKQIVPET